MSSQELEQNDILQEELEASNDVSADEQPLSSEEKLEEEKPNPYAEFLSSQWQKNNEIQTDEAKRIIEENDWEVDLVNGGKEKLTYKMLNRSEDVEVKKAQKDWLRMRTLLIKIRDPKYKFDIKDFIGNKILREAGVTGDTVSEEVAEIIESELDRLYDIRNNVLARCFFNILEENIDKYVYKKLTFTIDVAYSNYTSVPY